MPLAHAKLSASSSSRWLACPGSVRLSSQYASTTSSNAEEGTCAHELAEICLKGDLDPHSFVGKTLNDAPSITVDREMAGYVVEYINYAKSLGGELFVEERVSFDQWVPDGFGTSDVIVIDGDTAHVIDLKYGKGVIVDAEDNPQLKLYALGVLQEYGFIYDISNFVLHIYQPRVSNFSEWSITTHDLLKWSEFVAQRAKAALSGDGELSPGEKQCQWCAHKPNCKALYELAKDLVKGDFDNLPDVDDESIDTTYVLNHKSLIESWLKAIETQAFEQLMRGETVDGFKLVSGRSQRKWLDTSTVEFALADSLGDQLHTRKLVSPAQAEKLIGKAMFAEFQNLVVKPEGKPTLVPASDKRPAIDNSCADDFD